LAGGRPGFSLGYSPVGVRKGDVVALKLCVDRLLPIRAVRDRAVELVLPAAESAADLMAATAVVIGSRRDHLERGQGVHGFVSLPF